MGLWSGPRDGEIEQRVNALIARMNLDEKIYAHLNIGRPAAATELGIPIGQSRRFEARSRCGSQELEQAGSAWAPARFSQATQLLLVQNVRQEIP